MRTIAFDLDDTLCTRDSSEGGVEKYDTCQPIQKNIDIINECYNNKKHIIIYTARGMSHFGGDVNKVYSNLYEKTINQLERWGVSYHELIMGKIHYDVLVDDKVLNIDDVKSATDILGFNNDE
jgi:hydroxymethylpyrimidine pyrophosphatase-like HAD family hydrolase